MNGVPLFPEKLEFLFKPSRYKVAFGGRGGSKSWGFARALLLQGLGKKLRILCAREYQKSIKESVHALLEEQIQLMGIGRNYEVLDQEIRGANGTEFQFTGLHLHTVESIKSYEGYDIVWVEEGQTISAHSWKILIPTIRKEDDTTGEPSEIWVTFNPELESDPTFVRFITKKPANAIVVKISWRDNPWFNKVLNQERLDCKENYPDDYDNIWEGDCKAAVEGAIFHKEISLAQKQMRVRNVPYDPMLKVQVIIDLGFNDQTAIILAQKLTSELRIIGYIEDNQRTLADYSVELKDLRYNWGKVWLPHADGFSKDVKSGKGADQIMRALGWTVARKNEVSSLGVEAGIRAARLVFPRVYIDEMSCGRLIEALKRYRRHIGVSTDEAGAPLHDEFCHGGDAFRYFATNEENFRNDTDPPRLPVVAPREVLDKGIGY